MGIIATGKDTLAGVVGGERLLVHPVVARNIGKRAIYLDSPSDDPEELRLIYVVELGIKEGFRTVARAAIFGTNVGGQDVRPPKGDINYAVLLSKLTPAERAASQIPAVLGLGLLTLESHEESIVFRQVGGARPIIQLV